MAIAISTSVKCGTPLEQAAPVIAGLGIREIDLLVIDGWVHVNTRDLADDFEGTLARVDGLISGNRLRPIALNTGVSAQLHHRGEEVEAQRRREIEGLLKLMAHYDIKVAAIQPLSKDTSRPWEDVLRDCVATLREQTAMGEAAGVVFPLELHIGSPFETMDQAKRLLEEFPEVPVVYDPTHFVMQGVDIRETGWLMDRARHSHLRDAALGKIQAPLGEGAVDFDWVLNALKDRGYTGHFSIEYLETDEFDALDSAKRLYEVIQRHFPS
jgi:sugar phosphate isomerase/epimerase